MRVNAAARQRRTGRLEYVLEYIDAHPGETGDVEFLSALASISPFHFHRLMSSYLGESVSAYGRRRTLERAALRLLLDGDSVTAASAQAGYASSSAFARAFRRQFGQSPRALAQALLARQAAGAAFLPAHLEYRQLEPCEVLALRRYGAQSVAAPAAWAGLLRGARGAPHDARLIGIPCDTPELTPVERRRYDACIDPAHAPPEHELVRKRLGGGDHAVFAYRGTLAGLEAAHAAVLWHWYPRSGARLRPAPALHRLLSVDGAPGPDCAISAEILLPVERPTQRARPAQRGLTQLDPGLH